MTAIRQIMTPGCECIGEQQTLLDAAKKMRELDVGALPICGTDGVLKGMLTDRDIVVRALADSKDPRGIPAGELATGTPLYVEADARVEEVLAAMARHQVRRMPVIENGQLVGIVAQADIARHREEHEAGQLVGAVSRDE
ncbi:MAG: CBS domain-containing protein [Sciscionella sp.]|nr:CBS domain-containing protein [Sciscionella sp.]